MKPITILRAIYEQIICCCTPKYYVFRFDVITGDERSNDIDDTNVVSYRFINQGNTDALINGGLKVVSSNTINSLGIPIPGNDINLADSMTGNEIDTTIYKVKFGAPPAGLIAENCLVVISKVRATKRASQMVALTASKAVNKEIMKRDKERLPAKAAAPEVAPEQIHYTEIEIE